MRMIFSHFSRPCFAQGMMPKTCSRRSLSGLFANAIDWPEHGVWMLIARNEAYRLLNRRKRDQKAQGTTESWLIVNESNREPDDLTEQLQAALAQLSQPQQEVIIMKIYRQKTFLEISRLLGLSQNTVSSRYRYGIEKLRNLLGNLTL
ncbi:MAG: sigma-70 family RNA polymerase sigma factor [Planctomycetes bacterium]|nr:sigma-70 family RNA polymerase sigma factor [Planctomycetota bacterium]